MTVRTSLAPAAWALAVAMAAALFITTGCQPATMAHAGGATATPTAPARKFVPSARQTAFLDTLERRTFGFFWDLSDSLRGLTPDRWPTQSFISVGAVGFALTAYPIGAERGYVTREAAAERVLRTLEFFWTAREDTARAGSTGYRGFFYHFLVPETGARFKDVELSTMDSALLFAGALFCQSYFDRANPREARIRAIADSLYDRADWTWTQIRPPTIVLGWDPEHGHLPYDWRGYNETMLVQILALGSTTHRVHPKTWTAYTEGYKWGTFHGQDYLGFAPLFGYQYTHIWVDFRGIRDSVMRARGLDYFENSRRATLAQHAYAIDNPANWAGYGDRMWGLTACDGPLDGTRTIAGRSREFHTYWPRGATFNTVRDDGTISPSAAGGSIAFAPEIVVPTLVAMRDRFGDAGFTRYGFVDAVNPTLRDSAAGVSAGHVVQGAGWYDTDYLGIDEGPILAMTENYRSDLVWRTMRKNPHVIRGLRAAGFTGGWLDRAPR